jgi:hypothetical protein
VCPQQEELLQYITREAAAEAAAYYQNLRYEPALGRIEGNEEERRRVVEAHITEMAGAHAVPQVLGLNTENQTPRRSRPSYREALLPSLARQGYTDEQVRVRESSPQERINRSPSPARPPVFTPPKPGDKLRTPASKHVSLPRRRRASSPKSPGLPSKVRPRPKEVRYINRELVKTINFLPEVKRDVDITVAAMCDMKKQADQLGSVAKEAIGLRVSIEKKVLRKMKGDRTIYDGTGLLPDEKAKAWKEWLKSNVR